MFNEYIALKNIKDCKYFVIIPIITLILMVSVVKSKTSYTVSEVIGIGRYKNNGDQVNQISTSASIGFMINQQVFSDILFSHTGELLAYHIVKAKVISDQGVLEIECKSKSQEEGLNILNNLNAKLETYLLNEKSLLQNDNDNYLYAINNSVKLVNESIENNHKRLSNLHQELIGNVETPGNIKRQANDRLQLSTNSVSELMTSSVMRAELSNLISENSTLINKKLDLEMLHAGKKITFGQTLYIVRQPFVSAYSSGMSLLLRTAIVLFVSVLTLLIAAFFPTSNRPAENPINE